MKLKNKRNSRLFIAAVLVLEVAVMLIFATYAWIEGSVKPTIEGNQIQIASSPGLLMKLNGNLTNTIDLNAYLQDHAQAELILTEASSADGETLFFRTHNTVVTDTGDDIDNIRLREEQKADKNLNYLYLQFEVIADGADRDVWFDPDATAIVLESTSVTTGAQNAQAIRLSMQVEIDGKEPVTYIFCTNPSQSNLQSNAASAIDGDGKPTWVLMGSLHATSEYTDAKPLFSLIQNESATVTVRAWLEGGDPGCTEEIISGTKLNLKLVLEGTSGTIEETL